MKLRTIGTRAMVAAMIAALAVVAMGGVLLGSRGVSAAAAHHGEKTKGACLAGVIEGGKLRGALDDLVTDGTLTSAQETAILTKVEGKAAEGKITCTGIGLLREGKVADAVTGLLGMTSDEIKADWKNGQSLTEIAANKGISRQTLIDTITKAVDARLQEAVDAGTITAERKTELTAKIDPLVQAAVDTHRGDHMGGKGSSATPVATPA